MSVRNRFVLFFALATLSLLVACSSSSPSAQAPPSGGFSVGSLKGTYVFSFSGYDTNASAGTSSFFAMAGTLVADGSGNISGGTADIIDPSLGGTGIFLAQTISSSRYNVGVDGRGSGSLVTPQRTFGIDFVLSANGQGLITRFDNAGSGSGTLDLQGTASQSSLVSVSFSLSGFDGTDAFPVASAGTFTLDASGNVTAGTQDFNENGVAAPNLILTVPGSSLVLTSGTNGTAALQTSFQANPLSFDVWVIDSTHLRLIETDGVEFLSGDAYTQETSISTGNYAYTLSGLDASKNPFAAGGLMAYSGGTFSGAEDYNDDGSASTQPLVTATCATFTAGRCQLVFTGFFNGTANTFQFAAYPSSSGILLLEVDNFGITQGAMYAQSSTSLSAPQGYGLNLAGTDLSSGSEVDDIAEFSAQTVASNGAGGLTGIVDVNDAGILPDQSLGLSAFTPDSPATGRGSITTTGSNGTQPLSLEYYTVDGSNVLFIEGDQTQVASGIIQLQNASTSPGAARPVVSMIRPIFRSRAAFHRK